MEPSRDDGLKWFGEGFDGFSKRLSDNTVEYRIFVVGDGPLTSADVTSELNKILTTSKQLTKSLLTGHIWQHEEFALRLKNDTIASKHSRLQGRTEFGDSIADEWLIVYLLLEISKKHPQAWIRVTDADGEFLLIEAANALPSWLNPDVAENRVWISNGHLRIIPLEDATQHSLEESHALDFVSKNKEKLIISPFIEDAAFARLKDYPASIAGSQHHALITIPRRLAYILHENPAYTSPAIDSFYLRDAVSLRPLATKDLATLQFPPEDLVTVSVKFTKVGYAQLSGQVFDPPPSWTGMQPRMQDFKLQIGMKLTCGFEMMLADAINKDKKVIREVNLLLEEVDNGEAVLPDDKSMEAWTQQQDDEAWLNIDYDDFEAELSGKNKTKQKERPASSEATPKPRGKVNKQETAQDNLREVVSRFRDFVNADDMDDADLSDDTASEVSSSGEDKEGSFDDAEFEEAMREMMGMSDDAKQEQGLLDEARKLAIADGEVGEEEEDKETKEMMQLIEEELKQAGALRNRANRAAKQPVALKNPAGKNVTFGPELPPGFKREGEAEVDSADEEIGPGDVELSSDDEEDDYNDVDVNLARNLLQSFKGQAGAAGPAGNMMKALGINLPRDEDND